MKQNKRETAQPRSAVPTPRKRFRLERLEERIAPKKGGNGTNNCGGGATSSGTLACSTIY